MSYCLFYLEIGETESRRNVRHLSEILLHFQERKPITEQITFRKAYVPQTFILLISRLEGIHALNLISLI